MTIAILTSASSAGIVVAKSSLLLVLGWTATRLQHRVAASVRYAVWLTAILGVLLIPALDQLRLVPLRVFPAAAPSVGDRASATTATESRHSIRETVQPTAFQAVAQTIETGSTGRLTLGEMILAAWAIVAALMLVRLALGAVTVAGIVRRGRTVDAPDWTGALSAAARRLRVRALPRLVMSDEVDMAFAFEAIAPVIVLPANAEEWSDDCRHSVLLHELAHLRRHDLLGRLLAGVASALHWFNPFMWLTARQLSVESERACDELVLFTGVHPSDYAQHLLDIATRIGRRPPAIAMAMARSSDFEGRLAAILDPARSGSTVARRRGVVAVGVLALMATSIGAVALVPGGVGADSAPGIAFQSAGNQVAMAVESAARRGRLEILAVDSAGPILRNGLNLAPLGGRGDYYLFDSTSFVLVRPASKTFAIFAVADAAYNFNNGREGWPQMFEIPTTIRVQSVAAAQGAARQLERHGAFHIYWHVDADWDLPSYAVVSRGRLGVADAPLGESTVARWFGPALALAQLAKIDSASFPNDRIGLAAVAPLVGDGASTTNFMSKQRLTHLRITAIDLNRLTLPSDYTAVSIAGSLTESQAQERIAAWRAPPRAR